MSATDGELIRRFREIRDEAAFDELVRRHGEMVLGICRRVLGTGEDPEDAFQGTFLVLATRAAKLRKTASVASWLHGVALRVSLKAKTCAATRREHERRAAEMLREDDSADWREMRGVIDEEVQRLPERLRAPLVLCYFEKKSVEEAARDLGWTDGQLRGRLAKARDVLNSRLARRGVAVGAVALAALISRNASAAVPPAYVASTVSAASALAGGIAAPSAPGASLAQEVVHAMAAAEAKLVAAVVGAGVVVTLGVALAVIAALTAADTPAGTEKALTAAPAREIALGYKPQSAAPVAPVIVETPAETDGPQITGSVEGAPLSNASARDVRDGPAGLPAAVVAAVARLYPGATIAHSEREVEGADVRYDLELDVGGDEIDLVLSLDGKVLDADEGQDEEHEQQDEEQKDVDEDDEDAAEPGAAPGEEPGEVVF